MKKTALLLALLILISGCIGTTQTGDSAQDGSETVNSEEEAKQAEEDLSSDVAEIQNSISDIENIIG